MLFKYDPVSIYMKFIYYYFGFHFFILDIKGLKAFAILSVAGFDLLDF